MSARNYYVVHSSRLVKQRERKSTWLESIHIAWRLHKKKSSCGNCILFLAYNLFNVASVDKFGYLLCCCWLPSRALLSSLLLLCFTQCYWRWGALEVFIIIIFIIIFGVKRSGETWGRILTCLTWANTSQKRDLENWVRSESRVIWENGSYNSDDNSLELGWDLTGVSLMSMSQWGEHWVTYGDKVRLDLNQQSRSMDESVYLSGSSKKVNWDLARVN